MGARQMMPSNALYSNPSGLGEHMHTCGFKQVAGCGDTPRGWLPATWCMSCSLGSLRDVAHSCTALLCSSDGSVTKVLVPSRVSPSHPAFLVVDRQLCLPTTCTLKLLTQSTHCTTNASASPTVCLCCVCRAVPCFADPGQPCGCSGGFG